MCHSGFCKIELRNDLYITNEQALRAIDMICYQLLPPLNLMCNPIICALFNKQFRNATVSLLKSMFGSRFVADRSSNGIGAWTILEQEENTSPKDTKRLKHLRDRQILSDCRQIETTETTMKVEYKVLSATVIVYFALCFC